MLGLWGKRVQLQAGNLQPGARLGAERNQQRLHAWLSPVCQSLGSASARPSGLGRGGCGQPEETVPSVPQPVCTRVNSRTRAARGLAFLDPSSTDKRSCSRRRVPAAPAGHSGTETPPLVQLSVNTFPLYSPGGQCYCIISYSARYSIKVWW